MKGKRAKRVSIAYVVVVGISKIFRVRMRVHVEVKRTGERGKRVSIATGWLVLGISKNLRWT